MKRFTLHFDKLGKDPSFDWYFSLCWFAIGLVVIALADFGLYRSLTSAEPVSAAASPQNILNRADIESVAQALRAKDAASQSGAPAIPDPSI